MTARDPITVTLLGEPVPFARMRTGNGNHFVPSRQRNAAAALRNAASDVMHGKTMFDEPLSFYLRAEMPIPASWSKKKQAAALRGEVWPGKKPDLDNLTKLATDAFNTVVYRDDALICEVFASKVYGEIPSLIVTVAPVGVNPP
jgi:Holliday junction resolvase RusA-like endonuclease